MTAKRSKKVQKKKHAPADFTVQQNTLERVFWKKEHLLPCLILLLLPFVLYLALPFLFDHNHLQTKEYVLDDKMVLSENYYVKQGTAGIKSILLKDSFQGYLREQYEKSKNSQLTFAQYLNQKEFQLPGGRYRPLSLIMFAFEYSLFGLNPQVNYFISLLLYGLTGLLIFYAFFLFLPNPTNSKWFFTIPFIAAFLYILHPIHTEVIANIKSRDEILSMLLSLLTLLVTFRFLGTGKKLWLGVSALVFLLALLAKENAITFIAVIPLTFYFFTNESKEKILISAAPLLVVAVIYMMIRYQAIGYLFSSGEEIKGLMNNPFLNATTAEKYATIFYTLGLYVKLLFLPHPLTHDYYPYQIPIIGWTDPRAILSLLLMVALVGYAVFAFKKKSFTAYCILFYLVTLSIVSNLVVSVGTTMNERFLYMPSLGFCLLIAFWVVDRIPKLLKAPSGKIVGIALVVLLTVSYSYKTAERVPDWKNEFNLNKAAIQVSTNSARANQFYGYSLYRASLDEKDRQKKKQMLDEATKYVDKALKLYPTYSDALTTKAGLLSSYYQLDHDLDKLLAGFYRIQMTNPITFVDTYLDYLEGRADPSKLKRFYLKLGADLKKKGNREKGDYYLKKAQ